MQGFKNYIELQESYAKIAGNAFLAILQNYLQDKGINMPELPGMDIDAIMDHLNITYDMILAYFMGKAQLTDQEFHVLHHWCTGIENQTARKNKINITKACEVLCKHQRNLNKRFGKTVDYCREKKSLKQHAPDISTIDYKPDFEKEYEKLTKGGKETKLAPFWFQYRKRPV